MFLLKFLTKTFNLTAKVTKKDLQNDWCSLPPEILGLIAKNLREISDFVRFRAVCTTWRFSTLINDLHPQFPWILEFRKNMHDPDLRFYSILSDQVHAIHMHATIARDNWHFEPSEGYFLAMSCDRSSRSYQVSVINPLNSDEIFFPVFDYGWVPYWYGHGMNSKGNYGVCCGLYGNNFEHKLVSFHLGQDNWSEVNLESWSEMNVRLNFETCKHFYLKGMQFTVESDTGLTKVIDISTGTLVCVVAPVEEHFRQGSVYLVEASGDILRVCRHYDHLADFDNKISFDIHRMHVKESGSACWVKVKSIGNQALFTYCHWSGGFVLMSNHSIGIKDNSIYVLKNIYQGSSKICSYEVERINLETDAREHFPCPFKEIYGWFVPNLQRL